AEPQEVEEAEDESGGDEGGDPFHDQDPTTFYKGLTDAATVNILRSWRQRVISKRRGTPRRTTPLATTRADRRARTDVDSSA
ncbi:MAG TPA: hypothetical protein PK868_10050, partial [Phycicoccus sp.]|nr:hypothetical protein [Phycicoccus sp.]